MEKVKYMPSSVNKAFLYATCLNNSRQIYYYRELFTLRHSASHFQNGEDKIK